MVTPHRAAMYVDRFTSLDEIKGKDRGNIVVVLQAIMRNGGRFSVFDANNDVIARTLQSICTSDLVKIKDGIEYPWTVLALTNAGLLLLGRQTPAPDHQSDIASHENGSSPQILTTDL